MGTGSFPGVKSGRGVKMTPHHLLVQWPRKSRAISLLPLWAVRPVQSLSACTVQLYLYSPLLPSVPVKRCTLHLPFIINVYWYLRKVSVILVRFECNVNDVHRLLEKFFHIKFHQNMCSWSRVLPRGCTDRQAETKKGDPVPWSRRSRAIHLLPPWVVRPVQSLSVCTVELYLYSPYGPYGLYRASVPVSRAVPLLPLWTVRPIQSDSACTVELNLYSPYGPYDMYKASVPVQYSYTSTPPMCRMACTEPQCLYSTAIPLLPLWAVRPVQSISASTVELFLYSPYGPYGLYRASVPVQ